MYISKPAVVFKRIVFKIHPSIKIFKEKHCKSTVSWVCKLDSISCQASKVILLNVPVGQITLLKVIFLGIPVINSKKHINKRDFSLYLFTIITSIIFVISLLEVGFMLLGGLNRGCLISLVCCSVVLEKRRLLSCLNFYLNCY